ncbi:MAG: hypothetical protein JO362_14375 [Streptomycetaceae bacterium]|nr:hypothetical protein [Streptomycetaceae bacterium]
MTMFLPSFEAVPLDPHVTILVLPGGAVHVGGVLLDGPGDELDRLREAWRVPQGEAVRLSRPVRVSVARPVGRVEAQLIDSDGSVVVLDRHPHRRLAQEADLRWSDGIPDRGDLLAVVRAAERAGQWEGGAVGGRAGCGGAPGAARARRCR